VSRIEEVLKKLRNASGAETPTAAPSAVRQRRSAVPLAKKKKVTIEGRKYHVSQQALIEGGLLAPFEQAAGVADEFRRIKRPLIANAVQPGAIGASHRNVIMIASGLAGAGKTFCSVNLAFSMSLERELNVLLVDADVAKPHISRAFGLENAPGLIDLLAEEADSVAELLIRTDVNDIQVLPAGRLHPQATELLASERMSTIVNELATRYSDRLVIVDSPPLLITSEAQALASKVGQIALVVEAGRTSKQCVEQTLARLPREKPVNIILNKASRGPGGSYYGEYGYGYERR
jgi:protein-tyrosine kinase